MNLWLALFVNGALATSFLMPDTVTYPECLDRAREQAEAAIVTVDKVPVAPIEIEFRCIWRDDQPDQGELLKPRSRHDDR